MFPFLYFPYSVFFQPSESSNRVFYNFLLFILSVSFKFLLYCLFHFLSFLSDDFLKCLEIPDWLFMFKSKALKFLIGSICGHMGWWTNLRFLSRNRTILLDNHWMSDSLAPVHFSRKVCSILLCDSQCSEESSNGESRKEDS